MYNVTMSYYATNTPNYKYGNVTITAQGSGGYVLTSGGTSASNWAIPTATTAVNPVVVNQSGKISLTGVNADVDINGVSLKETLEGISEMLGLMKMDPALEKEFEELRAAGEHYRQLREKFSEQKVVWDTLKREDL